MSTQENNTEYSRRITPVLLPPSEYSNGDTPPPKDDEKYPEGRKVKEIHLGIVDPYYDKGYRAKEAWGVYTILHQGYQINDEPSACWVWCGNFRSDGEPILRLCGSSYFPRALMAKKVEVKGIMKNKCGFKNCINPSHLLFIPFKGQMKWVRAKRRPQGRDEFGRFQSPEA